MLAFFPLLQTSSQSSPPPPPSRSSGQQNQQDLIVLGLEFKATDDDLKNYFKQFGELTHAEVGWISTQGTVFNLIIYTFYSSVMHTHSVCVIVLNSCTCTFDAFRLRFVTTLNVYTKLNLVISGFPMWCM